MGADGFLAYYGLRWDVTELGEISELEERSDPRVVAARANGLRHWWGTSEEPARHFLLIGAELGNFGMEGQYTRTISDEEFREIVRVTQEKLRRAGFEEPAAIHFQFEPDY